MQCVFTSQKAERSLSPYSEYSQIPRRKPMKSAGEEDRASDRPAGFAEDPPIRPLHDCAFYFISLAHRWLERMTHLPFPVGTIIGWAEGVVDRWTHPLTQALLCHSLSILASIDDQMFCLVEGCGLCSKVQLKKGLSQLYTQGLIGTSTDLWMNYELALKKDIRKAVSLVEKVPMLNFVTPIFVSFITPSALAISDWLSKQGARKLIDSTMTIDSSSTLISKQEIGHDTVVRKNVQLTGSMINSGVADVQGEEQNVSSVHHREGVSEDRCVRMDDAEEDSVLQVKEDANVGSAEERCVSIDDVEKDDVFRNKITNLDAPVKDDGLHSKEDTIVDEVVHEQSDVSRDGIVEDDVQNRKRVASIDDLNADKVVCASEKIVVSHVGEGEEDHLPDVLEMLESSWLLGTSSFSKKASTLSRKKHTSGSGFQR